MQLQAVMMEEDASFFTHLKQNIEIDFNFVFLNIKKLYLFHCFFLHINDTSLSLFRLRSVLLIVNICFKRIIVKMARKSNGTSHLSNDIIVCAVQRIHLNEFLPAINNSRRRVLLLLNQCN